MPDLRLWIERLNWLWRSQFVLAIAIFSYFTLAPRPIISPGDNDLFYHFIGNLLLYLSARLAFRKIEKVWFVLGFVLIYSAGTEVAQNFVPGRFFDTADLAANAFGVLIGLLLALAIQWAFGRYLVKAKV